MVVIKAAVDWHQWCAGVMTVNAAVLVFIVVPLAKMKIGVMEVPDVHAHGE